MDHEQIVTNLIDIFVENDIEAFRLKCDTPTVTIHPDALGEQKDRSVQMNITPIHIDDDYIMFQIHTIVSGCTDPKSHTDIVKALNEINIATMCGAYVLIPEDDLVIHRHTVSTTPDSYEVMVALAVNDVLTAIDKDMSLLTEI